MLNGDISKAVGQVVYVLVVLKQIPPSLQNWKRDKRFNEWYRCVIGNPKG